MTYPMPHAQARPMHYQMGMPATHPMPMVQPMINQPMSMNNQSSTTVVVNSEPKGGIKPTRDWSTGICGCCEDFGVCMTVMLCPTCYACHLSAKAQEFWMLPAFVPGWLIALRAYVRGRHGIKGTVCDDCIKVVCCCQMTMCQLSRELDNIKNGKTPI